jgi:hypothetical protein
MMRVPSELRIVVRYRAIDNFTKRGEFRSIAGARRFAKKYLGDEFEIGTGYAVTYDGIGRITVEGTDLYTLLDRKPDLGLD